MPTNTDRFNDFYNGYYQYEYLLFYAFECMYIH